MNIISIPPEIGLTPYGAPAKTIPQESSAAKSQRPVPPELIGPPAKNSRDTQQVPQPVVNGSGLGLEFSIDEDTHTQVIKVIDRKSGDVVRQIPPEEVINFLRQFQKSKGLFLSLRL